MADSLTIHGGLVPELAEKGDSGSKQGIGDISVHCRFPLGLALIIFTGGDLYTGNCMYAISAVCEGEQSHLAL